MLNTPYTREPLASAHHQCESCEAAIAKLSKYVKLTFFSKGAPPASLRLCFACHELFTLFHIDSIECYSSTEELLDAITMTSQRMNKVNSDEARADERRDEAFDNSWREKQERNKK